MNSHKKKILFITTVDLHVESGGTRYSKSVLNALVSRYDVQVMTLSNCQQFKNRKVRWFFALLKSLFVLIPPNVIFHSGLLKIGCRSVLSEKWDVIVVDHLESSFAMRHRQTVGSVYVSHNREAELIDQKMPHAAEWVRHFLSVWVEHYEKWLAKSVGGVISISSIEAEWYRTLSNNVQVVYPVFDVTPAREKLIGDRLRIGFLGSATWLPNAEALNVLLEQILPYTLRDIELVLGGGAWDADKISSVLQGRAPNVAIRVLGYVPDIQIFWSAIDVFAAPITSGAGVNVKVCEAIANQVPVIALSHAVRGISDSCLDGVLVPENFLQFAKAVEEFRLDNLHIFYHEEFSSSFALAAISNVIDNALLFNGEK